MKEKKIALSLKENPCNRLSCTLSLWRKLRVQERLKISSFLHHNLRTSHLKNSHPMLCACCMFTNAPTLRVAALPNLLQNLPKVYLKTYRLNILKKTLISSCDPQKKNFPSINFHILYIGQEISASGKKLLCTLPNVTVTHCKPLFSLAGLPFSIKALRLFRNCAKKAHIIHHHFPYPFLDFLLFTFRPKIPTVVTYHADIVRQKTLSRLCQPLIHWTLRQAKKLVATSPNYQKSSAVLKEYAHRTQVIPLGLHELTPAAPQLIQLWKKTSS